MSLPNNRRNSFARVMVAGLRSHRDPVMPRSLIHSDEEPFRLRINNRPALIRTGELLDALHRLEPQQSYELHLVAVGPDEKLSAVVSFDLPGCYPGKNLGAKHFLVIRRVCRLRPAMPNP